MVPNYEKLGVDVSKTMKLIESEKIDYVFVDRSEGLYYEDFLGLRIVHNVIKYLMHHNISVPSYVDIL